MDLLDSPEILAGTFRRLFTTPFLSCLEADEGMETEGGEAKVGGNSRCGNTKVGS